MLNTSMKKLLDKILHTKFHVGWVFLFLGVSLIVCINILAGLL